jgi:hypothetical protein
LFMRVLESKGLETVLVGMDRTGNPQVARPRTGKPGTGVQTTMISGQTLDP